MTRPENNNPLNEEFVKKLSNQKKEPDWMLKIRLEGYKIFLEKELPKWGPSLSEIDFRDFLYYSGSSDKKNNWNNLPPEIRTTYQKLGIPKAEQNFLAGVTAQYDSVVVYEKIRAELAEQGVIFCDMDTAVKKYPEMVKKYFGTLIPSNDNKFAALNTALWSGGSFVYVPPKVKVAMPLQAYFRINRESLGQFERTIIIADKESQVHYLEGCTAPIYKKFSLHAGVVEVFSLEKAKVRYTTIQNWTKNVYNLVTKKAKVDENASMEWVDCNIGSAITMKYPALILSAPYAKGKTLSIAFANKDQIIDSGSKAIHLAPNTSSNIISKSISKDGGTSSYRGLIKMTPDAINAKASVQCDALLLDSRSRTDTYPTMDIKQKNAKVEHEATVSQLDEDKLDYLKTRGLSLEEAKGLLVNGFLDPITKEIPPEYSLELYRLINLEMTNSIG